jgi:protein gp37
MGKETGISWTNHTFNAWWGCEQISPACDHCYAKAWSERTGHGKSLPTIWGDGSTQRRFFGDKHWAALDSWNRDADKAGVPARVFVNSMSDTFEDREDLVESRYRLHAYVTVSPFLIFQLLTKRPENADRLWTRAAYAGSPSAWLSNVWLGATVEDRKHGVPRIAKLREVPARVRFLSCEPLLEDLGDMDLTGIHWVISGGESGTSPRPYDLTWARRLRDQCTEQHIPFFHKQLGVSPRMAGVPWLLVKDKKHGADISEFPPDLAVREFPVS